MVYQLTTTGGKSTRNLYGTGLPNVQVLDLDLRTYNGTTYLAAATHGRGAWLVDPPTPDNAPGLVTLDPQGLTPQANDGALRDMLFAGRDLALVRLPVGGAVLPMPPTFPTSQLGGTSGGPRADLPAAAPANLSSQYFAGLSSQPGSDLTDTGGAADDSLSLSPDGGDLSSPAIV